jgi:hypothetical protein
MISVPFAPRDPAEMGSNSQDFFRIKSNLSPSTVATV